MPPRKVLPLSSLQPRKEDATIPMTPGSSAFRPSSFRPKSVLLVLSGGSSVKATDQALNTWAADGFGRKIDGEKAPIDQSDERERKSKEGDVTAKLSAVVYELPKGEQPNAVNQLRAANKALHNLPITTIVQLSEPKLPATQPTPETLALAYRVSLPVLGASLKADEKTWLDLIEAASQKDLVLELEIAKDGEVKTGEEKGLERRQEELEELLGKSYEAEMGEQKGDFQDENGQVDLSKATKGVRIVLDNLAGPPNLPSSQLLRSKSLEEWTGFISRIALHPRVYLKLSPLLFPSVVPLPSPSSSNPIAKAASSALQTASNFASSVDIGSSYVERRVELRRRLCLLLNIAYEAFGEDRIIFATSLDGCGVKPTKGSAEDGAPPPPRGTDISVSADDELTTSPAVQTEGESEAKEELSAAEEWYELCRETFQQIGLGDESLDKIFNENAAYVYRI
ncbi:hypothetical protein K437DRAFT_258478 [Tilletiaria anomala UBC 951]|uniref:Uncharacterized protein n=1 Tax=Tilletiaria anomala (strain ATCC 24038 / CBS 436.72 / UBC 951) TaxID=1037660 RepID=A0A066VQX4_TILAU|nr:uncharacterized protein K437DRAFT_258478 [Tilletiaria anomala UBC 951]KDN40975.1 hypothetical protein K437DRAFT_258478 [Tilletiaria anomala UBC 951]